MNDETPSTRGWTLLSRLGWLLALLALVALGGLWHFDRHRRWETPALSGRLLLLRDAPSDTAGELWLVAVNPECSHCLQVLARLTASPPGDARVASLIVDSRARPDSLTLAALPGGPIWWDAGNDWRRRWGHRVYGEVLRFDRAGHYLGSKLVP